MAEPFLQTSGWRRGRMLLSIMHLDAPVTKTQAVRVPTPPPHTQAWRLTHAFDILVPLCEAKAEGERQQGACPVCQKQLN